MMYKKYIIIVLTLAASYLLSGCHGDLVREEYDLIFPENFFKNESDVSNAITALYNPFHSNSWGGGLFKQGQSGIVVFTEMTTDIMDCQWGDGGSWKRLKEHNWTAENPGVTANIYGYYNVLSRAETTIYNINNSTVPESVKELNIGQAEALQGWMAWILYDLYGPVPIAPLEVLLNPEEEVIFERPTKEWFVDYIESKLTNAISKLPITYPSSEWGRITKGAAYTMLLKLYMHEKRWADAVIVAREIMKPEYGYELLDHYQDVFKVENEQNQEIILAVPCNIENFGNGWVSHVLPYTYPYENSSADKWGGYRMSWDFYETFEQDDERLETVIGEFIGTDGVLYNRENSGSQMYLGALPLKYGVDNSQIGHKAGNDVVVYRLADVMLCLAEAINNTDGPTNEAVTIVNQIRNRVGLNNLEAVDYSDVTVFNETILLERGHELYCEGHRRQDLIRHGKYIEYAENIPNNQTASHKVLYPIPNWAIVESEGEVIQNLGY